MASLKNIVGGTMGGFGIVWSGHPFDTLKVRLQTQSQTNPIYSGLGDCAKKTWQQEGLGGFYKGVSSPLIGQMFFNAVQFMAYGNAQTVTQDEKGRMTIPRYFAAGAITGFQVAFIEGPIDLVKTKMQTAVFSGKPSLGFVGTIKDINRQAGIGGLYQGIGATVCRNIPAVAAYFGVYEAARASFTPKGGRVEDLPSHLLLASGGLGGFFYWFSTYPLDVIKSTMQAEPTDKSKRQYKSVVDCATKLYQQYGAKTFFRGMSPCLLRSVPANAVCFFLYEKTRAYLDTI